MADSQDGIERGDRTKDASAIAGTTSRKPQQHGAASVQMAEPACGSSDASSAYSPSPWQRWQPPGEAST